MLRLSDIKHAAAVAGFDLCGAARSRTLSERGGALAGWLDAGLHGGMGYMARAPQRRLDPGALVPGARTVIVCAAGYNFGMHRRMEQAAGDGKPRIASFALAPDYHAVLKGMLGEMAAALGLPAEGTRCFVDTAPILEKAWAVEAGLGWIGRNSLLIHPRMGSFLVLGEIVTTAEADAYDEPSGTAKCGSCTRCVDACPTGAITAERVIDTRRCISRLTIEVPPGTREDDLVLKESDPATPPPDLHGWLYGCDVCQSACPWNASPETPASRALAPVADPLGLSAEQLATLVRGRR